MSNAIGLYVHIPFCLKKCAYCDFCSFPNVDAEIRARYLDNLCEEIRSYRKDGVLLDTVFFGGGTPSLLSPDEMRSVFSTIRESFSLTKDAEITFECNPKTLTEEKAACYRELGFNRVSIGLQSANDDEERILGRVHNYEDFRLSYAIARAAGFDNINVDLMFGIPGQTLCSYRETLEKVTALSPEHLSCYSLILEEGTPFYENRASLVFPDEDAAADAYDMTCEILARHGYRHYEISNFAKSGKESRHNLHYWRDEEYIGVGLSAHSYYQGVRFGNTAIFSDYFENFGQKYRETERSRGVKDAFEYAMLALRLSEGLSLGDYERRFGVKFAEGKEELLSSYECAGLLTRTEDRVALTERGMYVSNAILSELL